MGLSWKWGFTAAWVIPAASSQDTHMGGGVLSVTAGGASVLVSHTLKDVLMKQMVNI